MTGWVEPEGSFSGTEREDYIFNRLFSLLCHDEEEQQADGTSILEWLEMRTGWEGSLDNDESYLFASLAKAVHKATFHYGIRCENCYYEGRDHQVDYKKNGYLKLESEEMEGLIFDEVIGGNVYDTHLVYFFSCEIDGEGNIIGKEWLAKGCLAFEKQRLSKLLGFVESGTDDPAALVNLGILCETGLAGVDRNLTAAWDYYLKAAGTEDRDAIEFVKKVFADDSREDLHELLANKCISRESYPVFFDLAVKEKNTELTAQLLEYKASLE